MGQKLSTSTANWSADDWAYGTGENVVQLEEVIDEVKQVPVKYFGGRAIENDASMQQMQHDLLSFDEKLKKLFFWRKKSKKQKRIKDQEYYDENQEYYDQNQEYYDQNHQSIPEEDEVELSPIYVNQNQEIIKKDSSWICKFCNTNNKSTDIKCKKCEETTAEF